jgi:hypothetical protein
MKATYKFLLPALLAGFLLGGCAEKDSAMPAEEAMPETSAPAEAAAEDAAPAEDAAEAASDEPGGYVPTDDERIPGETRP